MTSLSNIVVGNQVDQAALVQSVLEVAAQQVSLAPGQVVGVLAVALQVDHGQGQLLGFLTHCYTVDQEDDAWQEEHEQQQEDVPLHGDPVLDEECSDVVEGGKHECLWFSFWSLFDEFYIENLCFIGSNGYTL